MCSAWVAADAEPVDGLIGDIRQGESRSLVLSGEAGIGKTALLTYLIASASDGTVIQAVGVESDSGLRGLPGEGGVDHHRA